ncbi:MAG: inosine/xanthosine triphosphatase [Caldilineaceae bacterium]|nr:inosine/xanthosine triphosphatase [Caldilineaceae bacterium]
MKIAIGSTNPTKIQAAERAARKVWPQAQIVAAEVASGVAAQPMNDEETIRGAINRAKAALLAADAEIGMGVEGGIEDTPFGMFTTGWGAVVDRKGRLGIGGGGSVLLPESIAERLRAGEELGPEMDRFSGLKNVRQNQGAIGIFTDGLVSRSEALEVALTYALARFICPDYYE